MKNVQKSLEVSMAAPDHLNRRLRLFNGSVIKTYGNGSAVLIRPENPDWLRTSESGAWMAERLRSKSMTTGELVDAVVEEYGVPVEAVEPSIHNFVETLVRKNYVSCEGTPASQETEPERQMEQKLVQLTLLLTTRCDSQCHYCYIKPEETSQEMSLALAEELLQQEKDVGVRQIVISGGEPLLHSHLKEILETCRKTIPSAYIKLNTSGAAPTVDIIDSVAPLVNDVQFGLDGLNANTNDAIRGVGSFKRVKSMLERLQDRNQKVALGISFSPSANNLEQIAELSKLCHHLGVDYLQINQPRQPALKQRQHSSCECGYLSRDEFRRSLEMFHELYKKLDLNTREVIRYGGKLLIVDPSYNPAWFMLFSQERRKTCHAGSALLCIDPDGTVYPCSALHRRPGCRVGSFPERTLQELAHAGKEWRGAAFSVDQDTQCGGCLFRYFCGGGCRAAGAEVGQHDPRCELIQESFDDFFKYTSVRDVDVSKSLSPFRPDKEVKHVEIIRCA
jgi:radical SAM protein with 4Fe4S-binding SPASM domain